MSVGVLWIYCCPMQGLCCGHTLEYNYYGRVNQTMYMAGAIDIYH